MRLLPSEQTECQQLAMLAFFELGAIELNEPGKYDAAVKHGNDDNCYQEVKFKLDSGKVFRSSCFITERYDSSPDDWREVSLPIALEEIFHRAAQGWRCFVYAEDDDGMPGYIYVDEYMNKKKQAL
jgi:hypothetical protein